MTAETAEALDFVIQHSIHLDQKQLRQQHSARASDLDIIITYFIMLLQNQQNIHVFRI